MFSSFRGAVHNARTATISDKNTLPDRVVVKEGKLYFRPTPGAKRDTGTVYTPQEVVEHMLETAFGKDLTSLKPAEILELKICDPAMGSGHFLVECLSHLAELYLNKLPLESSLTKNEVKREVLDKCIYGIDINHRAVKLARMALWLESAHPNSKLERLTDQLIEADSLRTSSTLKSLFPKVHAVGGFDLIIGNPPYGSELSAETKSDIDATFRTDFPEIPAATPSAINPFALFLLKSQKFVKEDGFVSLLISDTFNTILSFSEIRNYLIKNGFLKSMEVAPLDTFHPLIVQTAIVTIGGAKSWTAPLKLENIS